MTNKELIQLLSGLKIKRITVQYSGSGDSGQTDDIDVEPSGRANLLDENFDDKETIREALDRICWSAIEDEQSGFYNNEGGFGELVIDVDEKTIQLNHTNYIQETDYSEHTIYDAKDDESPAPEPDKKKKVKRNPV